MHEDLINAIKNGEVAQVATFLEIEYTLLNQRITAGGCNVTPLALAIIHKQPEVVKYLLASGADIYLAIDDNNSTALQLAEQLLSSSEVARQDIKQILHLTQLIREEQLTSNDLEKVRPDIQSFGLILAARYNSARAGRTLLQAKAGFAEITVAGRSPLEWAQYYIKSASEQAVKQERVEDQHTKQPISEAPQAAVPQEVKEGEKTLVALIAEAKAQGKAAEIPAIIRTYNQNNAQRVLQQQKLAEEKDIKIEQKQTKNNNLDQLQFTDRQYEILCLLQENELKRNMREAIEKDDLSAIKSLITQNSALLNYGLMLAFEYGQVDVLGYLLHKGTDYSLLLAKKAEVAAELKELNMVESYLKALPADAASLKDLAVRKDVLLNKTQSFRLLDNYAKVAERCYEIITELYARTLESKQKSDQKQLNITHIINEELTDILTQCKDEKQSQYDKLSVNQKIDLNITVASLLKISAATTSIEQLKKELQAFFQRRETALHNTELDYCYAPDFIANRICWRIAEKVFLLPQNGDRSYYNILLSQASRDNAEEKEIWKDSLSQEHQLPRNKFIRIKGELLRIDSIITLALQNLRSGRLTRESIWRGGKLTADGKNFEPLDQATLNQLRELSPTLAKLITYAEELHRYSATNNATQDLLSPLVKLRDDLYKASAEDYKLGGNGTHTRAGEEIYLKSIAFAEWWHRLSDKIKNRIKDLSVTIKHEGNDKVITLGHTIDKLLLDRKRDEADTEFCAANRAWDINTLLNNASFRQQLMQISQEEKLGAPPCVTGGQLRYWERQIMRELEMRQDGVKCINQWLPPIAHNNEGIGKLTASSWDYDTLEQLAPPSPENQYANADMIFSLIEKREINGIKHILDTGVKLTMRNKDNLTPIVYAASKDQWDIVQLIARSKIKASGHDEEEFGAALLLAARAQRFEVCKQLLAIKGINTKGSHADNNFSVMHYFVFHNQRDLIQEYNKVSDTLNFQRTAETPTPLTLAAREKNVDLQTLATLLELKPDLEAKEKGKTALEYALESGQLEKAEMLLRCGASLRHLIKSPYQRLAWNMGGVYYKNGNYRGSPEILLKALEINNNVPEQNSVFLLCAAFAGESGACKLLLHMNNFAGDCSKYYLRNHHGNSFYTALHYLTLNNERDLIKLFCKNNSVNCQFEVGGLPTPLTLASSEGSVDITTLQTLLEHKPNLEAKAAGSTALQHAIASKAIDKAILLIQYGANFFVKNDKGETALGLLLEMENWQAKKSEILIALLSRKDLQELNLNKLHLDDRDLNAIEQGLKQNAVAVKLEFAKNKLTSVGIQKLHAIIAEHNRAVWQKNSQQQLRSDLQSTQNILAQLQQKQSLEATGANNNLVEQKLQPLSLQEFITKQRALLTAYKNSIALVELNDPPHTDTAALEKQREENAAKLRNFHSANTDLVELDEKQIPENSLAAVLNHWEQVDVSFNPARRSLLRMFSLTPTATISKQDYQATLALLLELYLKLSKMQNVVPLDRSTIAKEAAFIRALNANFSSDTSAAVREKLQAARKIHQEHLYAHYKQTILNKFANSKSATVHNLRTQIAQATSLNDTVTAVGACRNSIGIWASLWKENRELKNQLKSMEAEIKTMERVDMPALT